MILFAPVVVIVVGVSRCRYFCFSSPSISVLLQENQEEPREACHETSRLLFIISVISFHTSVVYLYLSQVIPSSSDSLLLLGSFSHEEGGGGGGGYFSLCILFMNILRLLFVYLLHPLLSVCLDV